jgi:hypothetical protein
MRVHVLHIDWIEHRNASGELLWRDENIDNILHDEGEQALLSAYFATGMSGYGAPPTSLYLGLDARVALGETNTLTTVAADEQAVEYGYARKALSTTGTGVSGQDFYINQPAAYYRADSKVITFTASGGNWASMTNMFLCTVVSGTAGKLICSLVMSTARTLADGDSMTASIYIGLSE